MKLQAWDPDLKSIVDRIDDGDIDLQPDFQRQEVWSVAKKRRLIDTILRSWSIPPIHLVVTSENTLEVLDGQQRLTAIRDFVKNRFSVDAHITPIDNRLSQLHKRFYKQLSGTDKRAIDQYTLRCFRITDYSPDEPSELFYRLNQPTSLTAGEQRNALYGPARMQLKDLVTEFQVRGNSRETIGFSNSRMAYDDVIAKFLYFIETGSFAVKSTEARISERFRVQREFSPSVVDTARLAISIFTEQRNRSNFRRFNKASLLSWLIFISRVGRDIPDYFMERFAQLASRSDRHALAYDAYALFQDRASLRVTDVSSVVYRDFCLWFCYFLFEETPSCEPERKVILNDVQQDLLQRDDVNLEFSLSQRLDQESWGRLQ